MLKTRDQPGATRAVAQGVVRRLVVLGSTGSIGTNTLEVVEHLNGVACGAGHLGEGVAGIEVVGLAAGTRGELLIEQAKRFGVGAVAVADERAAATVRAALPGVRVYAGPEASLQLVEGVDATDVCAAVVGSAGLAATLAAIRKGWTVSLANKETLVAAGDLMTRAVAEHGAKLLPVDSEHSAIFQCIDPGVQGRSGRQRGVRRIVLTASGGPFRTSAKEQMDRATVAEALNHPTWNMGRKITIDSASMMNKALEIVEAHWLFGLRGDQIEVIIHPQSVVHSFVEFEDHSVLAQLGPPDMRTPIQYALVYPRRVAGCSRVMDWRSLSRLDFEQVDRAKFRSLDLAYRVVEAGGTSGAVLNAANERAVQAFLDEQIPFGRIVELAERALDAIESEPADSLDAVMGADRRARAFVEGCLADGGGGVRPRV